MKANRDKVMGELRSLKMSDDQMKALRATSGHITVKKELAFAKRRLELNAPLDSTTKQILVSKLKSKRPKGEQGEDNLAEFDEDAESSDNSSDSEIDVMGRSKLNNVGVIADVTIDGEIIYEKTAAEKEKEMEEFLKKRKDADREVDKEWNPPTLRPRDQEHYDLMRLSRVRPERNLIIQQQRQKLPAFGMEQEVVEQVVRHDISIVCGDTGCGKSTQVPQFLMEYGLCVKVKTVHMESALPKQKETSKKAPAMTPLRIGVTQPRRVAAVAVCKRIGQELGNSNLVGYQVRYDKSNVQHEGDCVLKFMTDGVLLRELQSDFLCRRYSALVIDEAHERSINCDILLGLVSRAVSIRRQQWESGESQIPPLKLIIMSATLRLCDFTENKLLFSSPPPVITIDAKTFPVSVHFSKTTPFDYLQSARKKVMQIHEQLPSGSVLVFATGKREVRYLAKVLKDDAEIYNKKLDFVRQRKLRNVSDLKTKDLKNLERTAEGEAVLMEESANLLDEGAAANLSDSEAEGGDFDVEVDMNEPARELAQASREAASSIEAGFSPANPEESAPKKIKKSAFILEDDEGWEEKKAKMDARIAEGLSPESEDEEDEEDPPGVIWRGSDGQGKVKISCLYAAMSAKEQALCFADPEEGYRTIVIATNVAETSITLPNVRYVIDCGKEKRRIYLHSSGASKFQVCWEAKANADQRSGRAGRVGPGHVYRLFSSAAYNDVFAPFPPIQLLTSPLDATLLFMASLGLPKLQKFPFPTPPQPSAIRSAQERLELLGAVETASVSSASISKGDMVCTALGHRMASLPLAPRFAKILLAAVRKSARALAGDGSGLNCIPHACAVVAALSVGNIFDVGGEEAAVTAANSKAIPPAWTSLSSDVEACLWAVTHYATSNDTTKFCKENKVNERLLDEVFQLGLQLSQIIAQRVETAVTTTTTSKQNSSSSVVTFPPLPPSPTESLALADSVVEGLIDHVAILHEQKGRLALYKAYELGENKVAELHYSSNLRKKPPVLVVYSQVVLTARKATIRECMAIDPVVLAKLAASAPKSAISMGDPIGMPAPRYDTETDQALAFFQPKYVPLNYDLPLVELPIPFEGCDSLRYRLLAKALLDGILCNRFAAAIAGMKLCLKGLPPGAKPKLNFATSIFTSNQWTGKGPARAIILKLEKKKIGNAKSLKEEWTKERLFLLDEVLMCVSPLVHSNVRAIWPPIVGENKKVVSSSPVKK